MWSALARLVRPGGHVFISTINRSPKAFMLAIVGAEYLLRLLPRGTHEYERFIQPAELDAWTRAAGLELRAIAGIERSEEHTSELQSLMRISYAVFCLKKKK